MKKTLRFLTVLGGITMSLLCANKANAQVTAINANYYDSAAAYCTTPATINDFLVFNVSGTPDPLDSITVYINYGDGSDETYKIETPTQYTLTIDHTYMTTGTFVVSVTLTNTNMVTTTVTSAANTVANTCSALSGDVWLDGNSNCMLDMGEQLLIYHLMKFTNTTTSAVYYAYIDINGHYAIEVPDGFTYDIELADQPASLTPTCPNTSGVVSQAVAGSGTYVHDFAYECTGSGTDYFVWGYSSGFRPGFDRIMNIYGKSDDYCATSTATVTLVLDPLLTYTGTNAGPLPTVSGNTLTWTGVTVGQYSTLYNNMDIYTDPGAVLGTTICNTLYITYAGGPDVDINNDTVQICGIVANSFDPNDKSVSPNEDAVGTIADGTMLNFHINFQNTGNDTAYNVVIADSLSNNLDVSTFQLVEATHPVNVTWLEGNVINFRFEDIYLPDSNVNEPASHGSVDYRIAAKTGLASGTTINNTAHIYFDFNEAIVTNTTLNMIEFPASVSNVTNGDLSAKVYPNPANNELTITTDSKSFSVQVFDITGRAVATSVTNSGKVVFNTSSLASGMYMLTIKADGNEMTTKINVQH